MRWEEKCAAIASRRYTSVKTGTNQTRLANKMWKTKCFNEAMKNNSSIISLDTLISIIIYSAVDIQKGLPHPTAGAVIDVTVASVRKRRSFVVVVKKSGCCLYCYQLLPSAFFKNINKCIPLCFVSFNVLCISFVLIALLFINNQTELCYDLGMTRLVE